MPDHVQRSGASQYVQDCLDCFYDARKKFVATIAYLSIRFYGKEPTFHDVLKGTYQHSPPEFSPTGIQDVDHLIARSKEGLQGSAERRKLVLDKGKTLLTLNTVLLGLLGIFVPKAFSIDPLWMRILLFVAILPLLNAVTLLLVILDIGVETTPEINEDDLRLPPHALKVGQLRSYLYSKHKTDERTDYLVDVYGAARFYFLFSFTLAIALTAISMFVSSESVTAHAIVDEIHSDPRLIEKLRGVLFRPAEEPKPPKAEEPEEPSRVQEPEPEEPEPPKAEEPARAEEPEEPFLTPSSLSPAAAAPPRQRPRQGRGRPGPLGRVPGSAGPQVAARPPLRQRRHGRPAPPAGGLAPPRRPTGPNTSAG